MHGSTTSAVKKLFGKYYGDLSELLQEHESDLCSIFEGFQIPTYYDPPVQFMYKNHNNECKESHAHINTDALTHTY